MNRKKRLIWCTRFIFCAISFLGIDYSVYGAKQNPQSILPNEKIQGIIMRAIYTEGDEDKGAKEALNNLKIMARTKPEILVPQIIYFKMHKKNEREGWGILGIMKELGNNWNYKIRQGLIPLLETNEEQIFSQVATWLAGIDGYGFLKIEDNFPYYHEILKQQKKTPPRGLVNYLFHLAPSQALLMFDDIYWKQPWPHKVIWSDHIINIVKWRIKNRFLQEGDLEKAQKELDGLSKHEGWYARRYVVEVIREIPKLGTPEVVNRLKNDPNPLVSEAAKDVKSP